MFIINQHFVCVLLACVLGESAPVEIIIEAGYAEETSTELQSTRSSKSFVVYWNVPSFVCAKHGVPFTEVTRDFNIVQNGDDDFRGAESLILYDPGNFPALLQNKSSEELFYRNGGIPQAGNLTLHLETFQRHLEELVEKNFAGIGVIDFESWRPILRQNWGALLPYKKAAYDYEAKRHPFMPKSKIQDEAAKNFEKYGMVYMDKTLELAKTLRPNATWGYYAYPYCFNMNKADKEEYCSANTRSENDQMMSIFSESGALYPSVYLSKEGFSDNDRYKLVVGRVKEAVRLRGNRKSQRVLPYIWYRFQDVNEFISQTDVKSAFKAMKNGGADGAILWGSSNDVNTKQKCESLHTYIYDVLGPVVKQYTT